MGWKWGFPKIRGTILGVPIIKTIVFWVLYWGPLILGNYQILHLQLHVAEAENQQDLLICAMAPLRRMRLAATSPNVSL